MGGVPERRAMRSGGGSRHDQRGGAVTPARRWPALLRHPARWLLIAAWLVITAQVAVAAGSLITDSPVRRTSETGEPGRVQGRGVAGIFDGTAPSGAGVDPASRTRAVRALLATRAAAIRHRDRTAFLGTVAPLAPELRARQAALFDNLAQVPLGSWSYRLDPEQEVLMPPGVATAYGDAVWAPKVRLRYQLAGYDAAPTSQDQRYLFVRYGHRWYLGDDGLAPDRDTGTGTVRNLWDFGRVTAIRDPSVLVLGHPGSERLMRSAYQIARQAIPAVNRVWGAGWHRRVVVLVPADADELSQVIEESGDLSGMAAFTSADLPHGGQPVGKRVVVNPDAYGELSPYGRQVVLTHEITHVATGPPFTTRHIPEASSGERRSARDVTSGATPYWLAEGFADYVAYRATGASAKRAAHELAQDVKDGDLPDRLPEWADFRPSNPNLAQAYQESWLACKLIVARSDEATLVRLYRTLSRAKGDPDAELDMAMRDQLGIGTADFVGAWRRYLETQLGDE